MPVLSLVSRLMNLQKVDFALFVSIFDAEPFVRFFPKMLNVVYKTDFLRVHQDYVVEFFTLSLELSALLNEEGWLHE